MGKFDSKRVLEIGRGALTYQNIKYLKDNGAYVILADKCAKEQIPYRDIVDEVVELNIDDNDKVIEYAKANHIDAVFTNWFEESFEQARIINEALGNPYYHTEKQWQTFVRKNNFVKLCEEHGITTPRTYYSGYYADVSDEIKNSISFPAIIKPVDNAGGLGISVVYKKEKLDKAIRYAIKNSGSGKLIIEEYVEGKEVVFTYVVQDGIYKLTASADKYVYKDERNITVIPELYIYPCKDHDLYENQVNEKVISMMKSQGLNNCTIFFQTIEKEGRFYFFEAGLRFEGTKTYLITSYLTGQNSSHLYYDYLLKTKTEYDINKDDPKLNGHTLAMFAIHLKEGRIRKIIGADKIRGNAKITQRYYLGSVGKVIGKNPMDKCFAAYCMDGSDKEDLVEQIRFIKRTLKVRGYFNRNMIVDSFDESRILENK